MEVMIQQINKFKVTIDGRTWDDFEKCESWEGMMKFTGPSGTLIVDAGNSFSNIFDEIFNEVDREKGRKCEIIKVSPGMITEIKKVKA